MPVSLEWSLDAQPEKHGRAFTRGHTTGYFAFLVECFLSGRGLRTSGFTCVSSTGIFPGTSAAKLAPEGTT